MLSKDTIRSMLSDADIYAEYHARNLDIPNPSSTITTYQQRTSSSSSSLISPHSPSRPEAIQEAGMYHYQ